jgi:hypothetical protein
MRYLLLLVCILSSLSLTKAQLVDITFVNNSADPALQTVDVYVSQLGIVYALEDVEFQSARNVSDVAALFPDQQITIKVAPGNSIDESAAFLTQTIDAAEDEVFVAVVNGVQNATGFAANPDGRPITASLKVIKVALATSDPLNKSGFYFVQGATDVQRCDVKVGGSNTTIAQGLGFGDNTTTIVELTRSSSVIINVLEAGRVRELGSFVVDLNNLPGVNVLILSGFRDTAVNAGKAPMSLLAVREDGTVIRVPVSSGSQTARVQFLNATSTPLYASMNIWLNGTRITTPGVQYRRGTAFLDVAAGTPLRIGLAQGTTSQFRDVRDSFEIPALRPGRTYQIAIVGVRDTNKYVRNPNNADISVRGVLMELAREVPDTLKTALRILHAATDAPAVKIETRGRGVLAPELSYGGFTDYTNADPRMDSVYIRLASNDSVLYGFELDLRGNNRAVTLVASGFLDRTANNNADASYAFALCLVAANGTNTCLTRAVDTVAIDPNVSVTESLTGPTAWTVSPLPASQSVTVAVDAAGVDVARFELYSAAGVFVASAVATGADAPSVTFDAAALPAGIYLVRGTLPDGRLLGTTRLVISR